MPGAPVYAVLWLGAHASRPSVAEGSWPACRWAGPLGKLALQGPGASASRESPHSSLHAGGLGPRTPSLESWVGTGSGCRLPCRRKLVSSAGRAWPASERGWRRGRVREGKEGAPAGPPVCVWPAPRLAGRGSGSEPGSRGPARSARPQGTFSAALPGAPGGRPAVQPAHALFAAPPGLLCCGGTSAARAPGSVFPVTGRHSAPRIFFCAPGGQD